MGKKSFLLLAFISSFGFACSHGTQKSDRNPAYSGGGDVGSVGTFRVDCDNQEVDETYLENLKQSSMKAAQVSLLPNGKGLLYSEKVKEINNLNLYKNYILLEFNSKSAMRGQVQDRIRELASNGRNGSQGRSYLTADGNWCYRLDATPDSIFIKRVSGDPEGKQTLKAEVVFNDGYHGGYNIVTMEFLFDVRVTVDRGVGMGPNYVHRFNSDLISYPRLLNIKSKAVNKGD